MLLMCSILQNYAIGEWVNTVERQEDYHTRQLALRTFLVCSSTVAVSAVVKYSVSLLGSLTASKVYISYVCNASPW